MSSEYSYWRSMMRGYSTVSNDNIIPFPIERLCQPGSTVIFGVQSDKGFYYHFSGDKSETKELLIKLANELVDWNGEKA